MHEFGVSLRLWMVLFMGSRLNKACGKDFEVWNQIWKVLGYDWIIGFRKLKRKDDEMSRSHKMIGIYFDT